MGNKANGFCKYKNFEGDDKIRDNQNDLFPLPWILKMNI